MIPLNFEHAGTPSFYHDKAKRRNKQYRYDNIKHESRDFIAWDGEGAQAGKRQNYVLFGASTGDSITNENGIPADDAFALMMKVGRENPDAFHVAFAFDYDVTMILRALPWNALTNLNRNGSCHYKNYYIEHISSKWLQVTEIHESGKRFTVRICDMFGFFQCSFLKALAAYIPKHPLMQEIKIVEDGKAARNSFTYLMIETIKRYWWQEIQLMQALAEQLREWLYDVGLNITSWHGPGAIASFGYKKYNIKQHKKDCGKEVYDASRYAYAGGRFERFKIGRFTDGYGIDINSAYPYGISQLPSLTEGYWRHVDYPNPNELQEFGVYRIKLHGPMLTSKPSPLFHRDHRGNISYPWNTHGWYWSPEAHIAGKLPDTEIIEGWEYVGWHTRPFGFVRDIYAQRLEMKDAKLGAQMALKLFLNSLYGKMAQRVGWERSGRAPTWHQLEWAGWVTSATRAKLFSVMARIPDDALIAVETDGIYTTIDPAELGIINSRDLGKWEVTPFQEILYLQSGMYAKRENDEWTTKYRGLDQGSLDHISMGNHLRNLKPKSEWPKLIGPTTRFVGYRLALWRQSQGMGSVYSHLGRWEHDDKELDAGNVGKRIHAGKLCKACQQGFNAYEQPHDTVINSQATNAMELSKQHDIPWLDHERPEWRDYQEGLLI